MRLSSNPASMSRRGHPVCLAGRLLPELMTVREDDQGLRAVVRRHSHARRDVPVDSDIVHLNLNDRAAYERAYQALAVSGEESGGRVVARLAQPEGGHP